ncbi:SLC13 family permease [Luteolibacter sp. AS25]|uniref:SLC13 family permease n=1 Tax=Luteolibacter sp. AS25 TaxID=3135776 RepID=UPI00398AA1DD
MLPESTHMLFTFAVLIAVFAAFAKEWFSTDLVALGGLCLLLVGGVLDEKDLGSIFGNSAPLTIGAMFVLAAGLTHTGAIDWIAHKFENWAGKSLVRALLILGLITIPLSAFMNNTPVVIVFLPVIMSFTRSSGLKASKLLIPLSFLSILGGTITLIGTSTNLLVAGLAKDSGQPAFGIFEISKLGIIYAFFGFLYIYFIGRHLLPSRDTVSSLLDAEDTRRFSSAVEVTQGSDLIGERLIEHPMFTERKRTIVYEVIRQGRRVDDIPLDAITLHEGDILWFRGTSKQLGVLQSTPHVRMLHEKAKEQQEDGERFEVKTVEAIIGPQSSLIGKSVRDCQIRRRYGILVVAVHRKGVNLSEGYQEMRLAFGDTLLMEGPTQNFIRLNEEGSFLSLNEVPVHTRLKSKMGYAIAALLLVILVSALDLISISSAALVGAVLVIVMRCLNMKEAYNSIEWNVLFMIYGMLGVGLAMEKSGAAEWIAMGVTGSMQQFGPLVILAAMYLLVSILTELVTNNAVAILMTPIAISIAASIDVDARPFLVAIMFGASASFITPIGYQTNTYVYGAGGYRFADFLKIGIPLNLILWVIAVIFIPIFWPF